MRRCQDRIRAIAREIELGGNYVPLPYHRVCRVVGVNYKHCGMVVTWNGKSCICVHGITYKNCKHCRVCSHGKLLRLCSVCLSECTCPNACAVHNLCQCRKPFRFCKTCKPLKRLKRKRKSREKGSKRDSKRNSERDSKRNSERNSKIQKSTSI